MDQAPLVSVIMPAFNCEQYVKQAIDSILNQTYTNFELLIADDCSTDNTKTVIDTYNDVRIKTFHNTVNQGYLKASNKLFVKTTGELITFQDADDWSDRERIEKLVNQFKQDKELFCVGSFINRVDATGKEIGKFQYECNYEDIKKALPEYFNCVGSALMIKREILNAIGVYNEYFDRIGSEDLYWYGLFVPEYKTINIPECLYYYRDTPNSVSREVNMPVRKLASKDMVIEALKYYYKNGREIFNNKKALAVAEGYIIGKHECWRNNYKKGVSMLLRSILLNPFYSTERWNLLKMYGPKLLVKN